MSLFDEDTRKTLTKLFNKFPQPIVDYLVIAHTSGECPTCSDAVKLANELSSISNSKLSIKVISRDSVEAEKIKPRYVPAWIFGIPRNNIRYYGLPAGQEFSPFIYVHEYLTTGSVRLPENLVDEARRIESRLYVKVFVTPQCPYCPVVVDTLNQIGVINENVFIETIESMELPWEADKYRVMYVPTVIVNDIERIDGYVPPDVLVQLLRKADHRLRSGEASREPSLRVEGLSETLFKTSDEFRDRRNHIIDNGSSRE